ncbi:MAG: DUF2877 domain-containing protein [Deltaproteobacteria bacterium]
MNTEEKKSSSILEAKAIGHRALNTLTKSRNKAVVQGVFDHAFYIGDGGDILIKVIANKEFISPTSIVLEKPGGLSFKSVNIKEGMEIILNENKLGIEENGFLINLENASTWYPPKLSELYTDLSLEEINLNLRVLQDVIYTCPSREGLIPLSENLELYGPMEIFLKEQEPTVSGKARPHIERLMWGLFYGELETITENAESILGLGPGLTPSCDDFLAGLILSLNTGAQIIDKNETTPISFFKKASEEIARLAKNKTTIYSISFLNEAALGEGPEAALDLISGIITKNADHVANVAKTLIGMGETSGADISIGICYGIRFLISRIELRELNETA